MASQDEGPRRRAGSDRAQLRAALALEEAGELQEAARMFEYVGEHAQAASLRLEHADTLRDERQRLNVLREGCARNPADSDQGQALHRALGEALLKAATNLEAGAQRRALVLEAAQALELGQRQDVAGRLFEELGLLTRAARAYTEAGEIERLEAVHTVLEQREQQQREQRSLELEVAAALETGRRRMALELLQDHNREALRQGQAPLPPLAAALHDLERRLIHGRALSLIVSGPETGAPAMLRVIGRERLRLGRNPRCELVATGAALSREHAELALAAGRVVVRDLGSRAGTFLDGQALQPGEDWPLLEAEPADGDGPEHFELALGIASSYELWALPALHHPGALIRDLVHADLAADGVERAWTLFSPVGGAPWTDPEHRLPFSLDFVSGPGAGFVELTPAPDMTLTLAGTPLGPGVAVEILIDDELRLEGPQGRFDLQVRSLWP
ncbi:MAG: FHA domain-containing protein [Myxococcales bacterium]|nr:FHA domain-containing protein [Myxococcales bacterium]